MVVSVFVLNGTESELVVVVVVFPAVGETDIAIGDAVRIDVDETGELGLLGDEYGAVVID